MIITVTLNPAIDKTVSVKELHLGALNRIREAREDAGGKGINVSKTIAAIGDKSVATGFVGGTAGEQIEKALDEMNIPYDFVHVRGNTRTNMKVVCEDGTVTEINENGPQIEKSEIHMLETKLKDLVSEGDIVVFSGSAPKGVESTIYADLIAIVAKQGASCILDADGELFCKALEVGKTTGALPAMVKPNLEELERYISLVQGTGRNYPEDPIQAVIAKAREIQALGVQDVIVSLGKDGAVFVLQEGCYYVPAIPVEVRSTVGAGDALVAAYAYTKNRRDKENETVAMCMATATGAVMTEGTKPASSKTIATLLCKVNIQSMKE